MKRLQGPNSSGHNFQSSKRIKFNNYEENKELISYPNITEDNTKFGRPNIPAFQKSSYFSDKSYIFSSLENPIHHFEETKSVFINEENLFQNKKPLRNEKIVKSKKAKIKEATKMRMKYFHLLKFKNKIGENIKQHYGLWKFFIDASSGKKEKFYISYQCQKHKGGEAFKIAKQDAEMFKKNKENFNKIYKIGKIEDKSKIGYYGIPEGIVESLKNKFRIVSLFEWQSECISKVIGTNKNLLYFGPTSGGKSLVAELLMIRSILYLKKRCIYVLPFVSIVNEKTQYLKKIFENVNVKVEPFHGQTEVNWNPNVDIGVCTIEKANSILNKLMEEENFFDVNFVIFDEFHLIHDSHRGYLIEILISKIKYLSQKQQRLSKSQKQNKFSKNSIQIIGMSATLSNVETLGKWIEGEVYLTQFRPTSLTEFIKTQNSIFNSNNELIMKISGSRFLNDKDHVGLLTDLYIKRDKSVIIFCATKIWCENLAKQLSEMLPKQYSYPTQLLDDLIVGEQVRTQTTDHDLLSLLKNNTSNPIKPISNIERNSIYNPELKDKRDSLIEQLQQSPVGLCSILKVTIPYGVAYHHSGLTSFERELIEKGYKEGLIKVLVATSTLSTGINLPAKAVIFRSPYIAREFLDNTRYKQMSGRAGRMGFDQGGESIMICTEKERNSVFEKLIKSQPPKELESVLDGERLARALLESIASNIIKNLSDIGLFLSCTLKFFLAKEEFCSICKEDSYYTNKLLFESSNLMIEDIWSEFEEFLQNDKGIYDGIKNGNCKNCIMNFTKSVLAYLFQFKFLAFVKENSTIMPTPLGKAAFASSILPEESLYIFQDLIQHRTKIMLQNDLQLIMIAISYSNVLHVNWDIFIGRFNKLTSGELAVAKYLGITMDTLLRYSYFKEKPSCSQLSTQQITTKEKNLLIYGRFYTAMILNQLLKETSISWLMNLIVDIGIICEEFKIKRGDLQYLQQTTASSAGMLAAFCERLDWGDLSILFYSLTERLTYSVQEELLELMRIPEMRPAKARVLYNSGVESLEKLCEKTPDEVHEIFIQNDAFTSLKVSKQNLRDLQIKYKCSLSYAKEIIKNAKILQSKNLQTKLKDPSLLEKIGSILSNTKKAKPLKSRSTSLDESLFSELLNEKSNYDSEKEESIFDFSISSENELHENQNQNDNSNEYIKNSDLSNFDSEIDSIGSASLSDISDEDISIDSILSSD